MTDLRREERVLQLLRMLNHFLYKQKVCYAHEVTIFVLVNSIKSVLFNYFSRRHQDDSCPLPFQE